MTFPQPLRIRHFDSAEVAGFFMYHSSSRHLDPFMREECSLSEAAKAIGIGKTRMSYWVDKMLQLELIEAVRVEKRGRNRVPIYRATADRFTVPLDKVPAESDEQFLVLHTRGFVEATHRAVMRTVRQHDNDWWMEYDLLNGKGQINLAPQNRPLEPLMLISSFGTIHLTDAVANAAKQDLYDLMMRYIQLEDPKGKRYLYQILMVEDSE